MDEQSPHFALLDSRTDQSIFVVSGPSGSGKAFLLDYIMKHPRIRQVLDRTISVTSRAPEFRKGSMELEGREYYFVSREEFKCGIEEGRFIEYIEYTGNYYGTPFSEVERIQKAGHSVLIECNVDGRKNFFQSRYSKSDSVIVDIFIVPPSIRELAKRIRVRGSGQVKEEILEKRLRETLKEMGHAPEYLHRIVNVGEVNPKVDILRLFSFYLFPVPEIDIARASEILLAQESSLNFLRTGFDPSYDFKFPDLGLVA